MRLALSQYLRTLRERDEFDALLPVLLGEMGYVPLTRPQTGTRQFGVDFAAAGNSPDDGEPELLLFVIKQGDIGRTDWDGSPQAVRPSMDEIFDVYLQTHVPPMYAQRRKVVVLATTGDMKQAVEPNWAGYARNHAQAARLEFWGSERVSSLLERYLLNEALFGEEDWSDLRRSLALAGDRNYDFSDLRRLLLRQLQMDSAGQLLPGTAHDPTSLVKALHRVHLAARICAYWAQSDGDTRQAVWVMERTLLWAWHRVLLGQAEDHRHALEVIRSIWSSYLEVAQAYVAKIGPHARTLDGFSGMFSEGAEYALVLFEHIGLLACTGLAESTTPSGIPRGNDGQASAAVLAELLQNHDATGSPRLDAHSIDVSLALALFTRLSQQAHLAQWLTKLVRRLDLVYSSRRQFPIGSDSLEDLAELDVEGGEELKADLLSTSWMLPVVASWCAMLGEDEAYALLADGHARRYPEVGAQIWHPHSDWPGVWYFGPSHYKHGATEAPYQLPASAQELRDRIAQLDRDGRVLWSENSPAVAAGLEGLDFIACRHFRTPVPPAVWYRLRAVPSPAGPSGSSPTSQPAD